MVLHYNKPALTERCLASIREAAVPPGHVLVFDNGEIVQDGAHADLVGSEGVYDRLYRSWQRGTSVGS